MEVTIILESNEIATFENAVKNYYSISITERKPSTVEGYTVYHLEINKYCLQDLFELGRAFQQIVDL